MIVLASEGAAFASLNNALKGCCGFYRCGRLVYTHLFPRILKGLWEVKQKQEKLHNLRMDFQKVVTELLQEAASFSALFFSIKGQT